MYLTNQLIEFEPESLAVFEFDGLEPEIDAMENLEYGISEEFDEFEPELLEPEEGEGFEYGLVGVNPAGDTAYDFEYNEFDGEIGDHNYEFPADDVSGKFQQALNALNELDALFGELGMDTELEPVEAFLGKVIKRVARGAGGAVSGVARKVGSVTRQLGRTVERVTPAPLRKFANYYAKLASVAAGPAGHFAYRFGKGVVSGENVLKAAKKGLQAGAKNLRESVQLASMVAPFVPGIGSGIAAALGAANALASGKPITEAVLAGVRNALPGGAIAQTAFDMGLRVARGESLSSAALNTALNAARERIPGGTAGKSAFDAAVALGRGQKLQQVIYQSAGQALPASRFAANPGLFARQVMAGRNIQQAALSQAGQNIIRNLNRQRISLVRVAQGRPYYRRTGAAP